MIILSHPTANQNVRQAALALAEAGLLEEFWTCVNWDGDGLLDKLLPIPKRIRKELRRRSFPSVLKPYIKNHSWREWGRLVSSQLGWRNFTRPETGLFSMDAVYYSFDRQVARHLAAAPRTKAIYAYDNGALESFRAAKSRGLITIYEHPIVYWRKTRELQREEAERHPEWTSTLTALHDSDEKLARKDAELALADVVVVPSTFSKQSLESAPDLKARLQVIPYGAPPARARPVESDRGKLRVLFVGSLTQAKGLSYLFDAIGRLRGQIEFTLIGQRVSSAIPSQATLDGYRWIPSLPHDELLEEMSRHDVLVFPSLHEGFGLVMTEAMAGGLVVITTPHTAGPDLITDGIDGFIVPIRSSQAIEEKLSRLMADRKLLKDMKIAAQRRADALPWQSYRHQIASMARALMQ